ncbi:MAG: NADH-quinone oxidoreductase subunit L [Pirellulales bacterium]|nr:NADH-quinone oxidoreductase subunit L [Pirellulales bacterium]
MNATLAALVGAPPLLLLLLGAVPDRWANCHPRQMGRLTVVATLIAAAMLLLAALGVAARGAVTRQVGMGSDLLRLDLWFDALAAIMGLLISCLGVVVARYSVRYLDGDPAQGRFLRWIGFTLGAVLSLVVAGNLGIFIMAWVLTSLGLHQLLTHYADRPAALLAARKKFLISRLGDLMLVVALALIYWSCGSLAYQELFTWAAAEHSSATGPSWTVELACICLVLGAMTKSAQFPFHSWLPDTMETPTPVSALMHAGVINAGGFLVLRLSPLLCLSHVALDLLVVIGATTALFGALVMLTQVSIKRALAYSTVAQMGFMLLQCGTGAFAAALLHIVGHSLYKAHAFLNSGSAVQSKQAQDGREYAQAGVLSSWGALGAAVMLALPLCWLWTAWLGADLPKKPGGYLLGAILTLAVVQLLWHALMTPNPRIWLRGIASAVAVCSAYALGYRLIDAALADSIARELPRPSALDVAAWLLVLTGFAAMFGLQAGVEQAQRNPALRALWVHAVNGFYVDIFARRMVTRVWRRPSEGAPLAAPHV